MEEEFKDEEDMHIFEENAEVMGIQPNFKIKNGETVRQTAGPVQEWQNQSPEEDVLDGSIQEDNYDDTDGEEDEEEIDEDEVNSNEESQDQWSEVSFSGESHRYHPQSQDTTFDTERNSSNDSRKQKQYQQQ